MIVSAGRMRRIPTLGIFIRGASPLGLPCTRSRSPLRRFAPCAWLASLRSLARSRLFSPHVVSTLSPPPPLDRVARFASLARSHLSSPHVVSTLSPLAAPRLVRHALTRRPFCRRARREERIDARARL